jgi:hypothetical protein
VPTSSTFEIFASYRSQSLTVTTPSNRSVLHNSETLATQTLGFKVWSEDQKNGFTLYGGTQEMSQFRGVSASQLTLEHVATPYAGTSLTFNIKNGKVAKLGVDISARYYFAATSGLNQTEPGLGFGAALFYRLNVSKRLSLQIDAGASLQNENSALTVQQQTDYDLGGRFIYHF